MANVDNSACLRLTQNALTSTHPVADAVLHCKCYLNLISMNFSKQAIFSPLVATASDPMCTQSRRGKFNRASP